MNTVEIVSHWKNIPKQTLLNENGEIGDCWRCCIAAIVGVPALDAPHFVKEFGSSFESATQEWLRDRGWTMLYMRGGSVYVPRRHSDVISFPVIACGPTNRSRRQGEHHAVVLDANGEGVLYDPHPSGAGLLVTVENYVLLRQWHPAI